MATVHLDEITVDLALPDSDTDLILRLSQIKL